jgi:hypothetical protein
VTFSSSPIEIQSSCSYKQPIIVAKAVVVLFGIVYVAAFTVVIMYIASRLFATEKILTAKLRFKRGAAKEPSE